MMKKTLLLSFIVVILSFLAVHLVQADFMYRIQIDEVINRRNIIITHPETDEKYLLHLESGCGELEDGQNVSLSIRGRLNSNYDIIKIDAMHRCNIDFAEKFTQKLFLDLVLHGNEAYVTDESGQKYFITYTDFCRSMPRYWKDYIYVFQTRPALAKGAKIFLPNKDGQCSIDYVRKIQPYVTEEPEEPDADKKVPTTVTRVRAFPRNGKVSLSWRPAQDNVGISHYIVSYSPYKIRTESIPVKNMPNQIQATNTYLTIENLKNDETYFFYVLAVDTSNNVSSRWSQVAEATPRSSILPDEPSVIYKLNLRMAQETPRSFLFEWDHSPIVNRYSVVVEADKTRILALTGYPRHSIRVLKRDSQKGKQLTLKVRAYSLYGLVGEEKIDFGF